MNFAKFLSTPFLRTPPLAAPERAISFSDKGPKEREKERSEEYSCRQRQY